jgi:hypothetical protein
MEFMLRVNILAGTEKQYSKLNYQYFNTKAPPYHKIFSESVRPV